MNDNEISRLSDRAQACLGANDLGAAKALYARICELDENSAEAWLMLGAISGQEGLVDDAIRSIRRAVELDPENPAAHLALAQVLLTKGDQKGALSEADRAVAAGPDSAEAWSFLGALAGQMGDLEQAETSCRRALDLEPMLADAQINLAYALHRAERLQEAEVAYREGLALRPDLAQAHADLGNLLIRLGRFGEAIDSLKIALRLAPDYGPACLNLGVAQARQGDLEAASAALSQAVKRMPEAADPWIHLGLLREDLGDVAGAVSAYRRAVEIDSGSLVGYFRMGVVLASEGRWDDALEAYRQVSMIAPEAGAGFAGQAEVYMSLSDHDRADELLRPRIGTGEIDIRIALASARLCGYTGDCSDPLRYLEYASVAPDLVDSDRADVFFALGRLRDRIGADDEAFRDFMEANTLKRRPYDRKTYVGRVDSLIRVFSPQALQDLPISRKLPDSPILLVGMPLSGAEILEQMLARNPEVTAGGEPAWLPEVFDEYMGEPTAKGAHAAHSLAGIRPEAIDRAVETYRRRLPANAARVTDRATGNIEYLGWIHRMFPNARIIYCARDPVDTCFSCYLRNFAVHHAYAYDLADLGARYRQYERLLRHWTEAVGIPVLQVRYEELVAFPKEQFEMVLDHCGLGWVEGCLEPLDGIGDAGRPRPGRESLAAYAGMAGRWKRYERHLGSLFEALAHPAGSE